MSQQSVEESMKKPKCYTAVVVPGEGFTLGIAVEGEPGYYKTDYPAVKTWDEAVRWASDINEKGGISEKRAFEIVASTMAAQREAEEARERVLLPGAACPHCDEQLGKHSPSALGQHLLMSWGVAPK